MGTDLINVNLTDDEGMAIEDAKIILTLSNISHTYQVELSRLDKYNYYSYFYFSFYDNFKFNI